MSVSIILFKTELDRPDNNGLQNFAAQIESWQKQFGVPMADLIKFAAIYAVVSCPLGSRIRLFTGRTDSNRPAPGGLLPLVTSSAYTLINLFEDKTISPHYWLRLEALTLLLVDFASIQTELGLPRAIHRGSGIRCFTTRR